jgi:heme A synthase
VALLVLWTARRVLRSVTTPRTRRLAGLAVVLVVVQIALGAANVWSRLSALFVVPHLAVGAALWATVVLLYLALRRSPAL